MANNRAVKKNIRRLEHVKTWQLLILLLLALLISASFLRLNNIGMVQRREAVLASDKQGDQTAITNNLFALQRFSSAHMNAASGTIYLEEQYKRDVQKLVETTTTNSNVDSAALQRADEACRAQFPGYSQAYVQCNASEQAKYQSSSELQSTIAFPNPELYRHNFISPAWSPDFAGWSLAVCAFITVVILFRIIGLLILRALLRHHYSSI